MQTLTKPSESWRWLKVPITGSVTVTLLGEPAEWWAHFVRTPGLNRPLVARCRRDEAERCELCERGLGRKLRYVLPIEHNLEPKLVEFSHVNYYALNAMLETGGCAGRIIVLSREWNAQNAPVCINPNGRAPLSAEAKVDITSYVTTLGQAGYRAALVGQPPRGGRR